MRDTIDMAREAAICLPKYTAKVKDPSGAVLEFYKRFEALVRADEREACAKVCEGWDFVPGGHEFTPQQLTKNLTDTIAARIRARGNT
jgi:hypothetical protein